MHSGDFSTYPTKWEQLVDSGVEHTDMTLIYNAHGTPENAATSVEYIQPNSVVFIEGYSIRKAHIDTDDSNSFDLSYELYLNTLNNLRLQGGKNHPDYKQFKESILLSIDDIESIYTPISDSDFTLHNLAEIKGLLKKDCMVFYADYKDLNVEEDNPEKVNVHDQRFHALVRDADKSELADMTGSTIGNTLRGLTSGVRAKILKHEERELHATLRSLSTMGGLAVLPTDVAELSRGENGNVAAYTIFGTAHARSLTHQFVSRGVRPTVVVVEPIADHLYLDAPTESGHKNYRRRVGHAALSTIAYRLTHEFVAPALVEDAYDHLEFLNEASKVERLSFLVTCAYIQKLLGRGDRKTAEKEYLALLRSFMPRSAAFKPPKSQTIYALPSAS